MLLDFLELISHPEHYRTTWRDGDFIVEHAPEAQNVAAGSDQQLDGAEVAGLADMDLAAQPAE